MTSLCSQHLYNLVHVDLSYNNLRVLEAAHTRLGNIKTLNLAGNQLDRLTGLTKLYSLVSLDLSHNQLAQVSTPRTPWWPCGRIQKHFSFHGLLQDGISNISSSVFFLTLLCKNCIKKLEKTKNMYIKDVNEYWND